MKNVITTLKAPYDLATITTTMNTLEGNQRRSCDIQHKNKAEGLKKKKANLVVSSQRRICLSLNLIFTHLFSMSSHLRKVSVKSILSNCQAILHAEPSRRAIYKRLKYLWQVEGVKVVVRAWAMGSRPPNSFSCCYGNCEERKTKQKRENICLGNTH